MCKSVTAKPDKVIIDKPSSEIKKLTNNTMLKTTMSLQQEISVLNSTPEKKTRVKEQENEKQEKLNVVREFIKVSGKFIIQYFAKICSLKEEEMHAAAALNESYLVAFEDTLELLCDFVRNNLVNLESLKDSFNNASSNQELTRSASNPDLSRSAETQTENNETTLATNKLNGDDKILDESGFLLLPMAQQKPIKKFNLSLNPKGRSDSQVTASKENNSETDDKNFKSEKKLTDDELDSSCTTKCPSVNLSSKLINDIEIHDDMIAIKEELDNLSSKSTVLLPEDAQSPPVNKTEDPELETSDTKSDSELLQHSDKESEMYIVYRQNKTASGTSEMNNDEASSLVDNISSCSSLDRLQAYCDLRFCSSDNGSSTASDVSSVSTVDNHAIVKASKAPKVPLTKPCSVHLEQLDVDKHMSKKRIVSGDLSEDRHIKRLINLQSLERVRKDAPQTSSSGPPSKKSRTRKQSSSSSIISLLSNDSSVDLFGSEVPMMHLAEQSLDAMKKNLDLNSSDCDSDSVLSGGSDTTKKRKRISAKDRDKDKGQGGEQPAWMQDKLLTGQLGLADSPEPGSGAGAGSGSAAGTGTGTEARRPLQPDSDCEEVVLSQDGDSQARGRRNIRKVKSDDLLEETTKLANQEEEERKRRRDERLRSIQEVLSQTPLDQEQVGLLLDVDEGSQRPALWVPARLTTGLKDHQLKGIKFMWDACFESMRRVQQGDKGAGCILAHCMGLGKTKQVVVLSHTLLAAAAVHKVLVVCPLSTVSGWRGEFARTLQGTRPAVSVRTVNGLPLSAKLAQVCDWHRDGGVLLIGYEMFLQLTRPNRMSAGHPVGGSDPDLLRRALLDPGPDLVVCDEGHMLRNGRTLRWRSLENMATRRRIILTGTPLQNNLKEYYYMVQFVKPNLLGTYKEYLNRFVNPITNGQYEDSGPYDIQLMRKRSHVLHKKLENTIQRFEAAELEQYLPPKLDYVLFVQLTKLQIELYRRYLQLCASNQPENRMRGLFTNYHNLQMVWTHPGLLPMRAARAAPASSPRTYDEDFVVELDPDSTDPVQPGDWFADLLPGDVATNAACGPKLQILMSIVGECEALSDKLLVFSSSILELDLIEQLLQRRGFARGGPLLPGKHYYRLDGTVPPDVRTHRCDNFNDPTNRLVQLLLISHKVGGLGLNLVAANRVVLMDVSWNPSYDVQSVFRVYRFGQTKPCYVYRLVSMGTMEEVVYSRAVTKLAVAGRVVDDQQILRHFKSHDLQRMYQLNCDYRARPNQSVPADRLLAKLLQLHTHLYRYQEHQALLENQAHEELTEHDMRLAWDEFEKEEEQLRLRKMMVLQPPVPFNPYDPGPNPMNYTVNPPSAVVTTTTTAAQNVLPPTPLLSFSGLLEANPNRAQPTSSGSSTPVDLRMILPQTKPAKPKSTPTSASYRNIQRYRLDDASLIRPPRPNVLRRQSLPFVKKAVGSPTNYYMRTSTPASTSRPVVHTYQRKASNSEGRGSTAQQQLQGLLTSFTAQIHDKVHTTENKRVEGNVSDDTDNIHDIITELDSVAELYERPPQSTLLSDNSNNARWPIFRRAKPKETPQPHPSLSQQKDDCIITIE